MLVAAGHCVEYYSPVWLNMPATMLQYGGRISIKIYYRRLLGAMVLLYLRRGACPDDIWNAIIKWENGTD
jgi:hypothetical protein